ncbi:MAG: DUF2384 domain-containing protein [Acetobacteraceae bacterium]|jgi:putative toxin-antitoxin system antitoxin component, TIGR02293 family|nr:DUF2384 domain-containing protein [Acetobacteraceae bacterium]
MGQALRKGARDAEGAAQRLGAVADLLGGARVLRRPLRSRLDAHDAILEGLPGAALKHLVDRLAVLREPASLEKALGMSLRTVQRHRDAPAKPLGREQSGRVWEFAELFAKATAVFGSKDEAERWMARPAIGLEQRRPIDLLATPEGRRLVAEHLERLEYGVYA